MHKHDAGACQEVQANRRAPDFRCSIKSHHAGPHVDPETGTLWGHRGHPRWTPLKREGRRCFRKRGVAA